MTYKCKKGDVIAIERTHSNHSIGMARTEWKDWTLGRAFRVDRKGMVQAFVLGERGSPYSIDNTIRIATIADDARREAANRLLSERGSEPFDTREELVSAILDLVAA